MIKLAHFDEEILVRTVVNLAWTYSSILKSTFRVEILHFEPMSDTIDLLCHPYTPSGICQNGVIESVNL